MKISHRTALAGIALATAGLLAGCSGTGSEPMPSTNSTTSAPAASHNEQDTTFAQMMIVHHKGAIEMAGLAGTRTKRLERRAKKKRHIERTIISTLIAVAHASDPKHAKNTHRHSCLKK